MLGSKGFQDHANFSRILLSSPSWFSIPILGGSLILYISFQSILTLYLLIMQVITWVLVPSATFPNPLWAATTKTALFRGHFLFNEAKMLVGCIQCGGNSFSLNYSYTIPPWVSYCTCPFFGGTLGGYLWRRAVFSFWDLGCREQDRPRQSF